MPKFVVATELQALHNSVVSAWMKLRVERLYRFGNLGLKYAAFLFQPTHRMLCLRFYKIIVLCGQILLSERDYGNSSVFVSRQ